MSKFVIILAVAATLILSTACSGRGTTTPTPRPRAFQRIELPPNDYRDIRVDDVTLRVNSAARVDTTGPSWFELHYPGLRAVVYLTINTFDTPDECVRAVANRRERISLNLNGAEARVSESHAGRWATTLVVAPEARNTPVQLLSVSTDGRRMVSAAAFLAGVSPQAPVDSLTPVVDALEKDMITLGLSLDGAND